MNQVTKDLGNPYTEKSCMVCSEGGAIYFLNSGQNQGNFNANIDSNILVTRKLLDLFGFAKLSTDELKELNDVLLKYNITGRDSLMLFLATVGHESGMGTDLLEIGNEQYFNNLGYTTFTSGAGYIQVTAGDQVTFLNYIKSTLDQSDPSTAQKIVDINNALINGADRRKFIADNYAWEAAGWEWGAALKGSGVIMNDYVNKYGGGENIYLITQYFINSYLPKASFPDFDSDLSDNRKGASYKYNFKNPWSYGNKSGIGTVEINGNFYRLPGNYSDRLNKYISISSAFLIESIQDLYEN